MRFNFSSLVVLLISTYLVGADFLDSRYEHDLDDILERREQDLYDLLERSEEQDLEDVFGRNEERELEEFLERQLDTVTLPREYLEHLEARKTTSCGNDGKISRNKFDPKCLPENSKGFKSAHNCQGKSYLCVLSGKGYCYSIAEARKGQFENGECFL